MKIRTILSAILESNNVSDRFPSKKISLKLGLHMYHDYVLPNNWTYDSLDKKIHKARADEEELMNLFVLLKDINPILNGVFKGVKKSHLAFVLHGINSKYLPEDIRHFSIIGGLAFEPPEFKDEFMKVNSILTDRFGIAFNGWIPCPANLDKIKSKLNV